MFVDQNASQTNTRCTHNVERHSIVVRRAMVRKKSKIGEQR